MSNPPPPDAFNPPPVLPYAGPTAGFDDRLPTVDPSGSVISDSPCRKCSYNLRGLSINGRCPECGTPVGLSVHGELLRFADPNWVRDLQRGIRLILLGIGLMIFGFVVAILIAAITRSASRWTAISFVLAYIAMLIGAWKLTEPEPGRVGDDPYKTHRQIIRFALIVAVVHTTLAIFLQPETLSPTLRIIVGGIGAVAGLIGVAGQVAQLSYLSKLSMRIPDIALADRAKLLIYGIGIPSALMALVGFLLSFATPYTAPVAAAPGSPPTPPAMPGVGLMVGGCVSSLAGLTLLVFFIMYLLMIEKLGKRFAEQADAAEATWVNSPPPPLAA